MSEQALPTVIIGSSRVQFGIDLDTWEEVSGQRPIQLAMGGRSALPVLDDLARDEHFRGRLLIGVTPDLFFVRNTDRSVLEAGDVVAYSKEQSPSQRLSHWLGAALDSRLVSLEEDGLSMQSFMDRLVLPNRQGVPEFPVWPYQFSRGTADRQEKMLQAFLNSPAYQQQMIGVWAEFSAWEVQPMISGDTLQQLLESVRLACDRIEKRGGEVLFVRMPSTGSYLQREKEKYPREHSWDLLLAHTGRRGYYFADYPSLAGFDCPEESHLSPEDAKTFTRNLLEIMRSDRRPPLIIASHPPTP
ncbi:hypothetical protein [Cesiribacter andamanensis]|uniref:hypothetical protein n=1 Tax=Cesiribacter andamanensis TaxID=649507 RepID=UPI000349ECA1|nr:hypothetical protein [Cesiribacter andamanensis]